MSREYSTDTSDTAAQLTDEVEAALRQVKDPEAEMTVFEAGLVEDIHVNDGRVTIDADLSDFPPQEAESVTATRGDGGSRAQPHRYDSTSLNRIDCIVERVIPEGRSQTVFLDCGLPETFKAVVDTGVSIDEGDAVTVEIDASDVVVV